MISINTRKSSKKREEYINKVGSYFPYSNDIKKQILEEFQLDIKESIEDKKDSDPEDIFGNPREVARNISLSVDWKLRKAGLSFRFVSYIIDWCIGAFFGFIVALLLMISIALLDPTFFDRTKPTAVALPIFLVIINTPFLVTILYFMIMEGRYSTTIGKKIFNLKIIDSYGIKISWNQALVRSISKVFIVFLFVDVMIGFFYRTVNQRSLEYLSGTWVVYCEEEKPKYRKTLNASWQPIIFTSIFLFCLYFQRFTTDFSDNIIFLIFNIILVVISLPSIIIILLLNAIFIQFVPSDKHTMLTEKEYAQSKISLTDETKRKSAIFIEKEYLQQVEKLLPYSKEFNHKITVDLQQDLKEAMKETGKRNPTLILGTPREAAINIILSIDRRLPYCSLNRRFLAFLLDSLIGYSIGFVVYITVYFSLKSVDPNILSGNGEQLHPSKTILLLFILLIPFIIQFFYFILLEGLFSATIGKILLSMVITDSNHIKITGKQSIIRNLSKIFPFFLAIDCLIGFTKENKIQRATETIADTYVLEKGKGV